jgi:glycosyltransferase involved in cell wall biosynthesis
LESITSQLFSNYEIIILDSNSSDSTLKVIDSLNYHYHPITIYKEKDLGIYDALNKGISLSKGSWLYFLGSDDYLYDNFVLYDIYSLLQRSRNLRIIYGNVWFEKLGRIYDGEFDSYKLFSKNICHQGIFYNRLVFDIVGKFSLRYPSLSDYDHNLRWFFNKQISVLHIDRIIAFYSDGGFSATFIDEKFNLFKKKFFIYKFIRTYPLISIELLNQLISHYKHRNSTFIFYYYRFFRFFLRKYSKYILFVS